MVTLVYVKLTVAISQRYQYTVACRGDRCGSCRGLPWALPWAFPWVLRWVAAGIAVGLAVACRGVPWRLAVDIAEKIDVGLGVEIAVECVFGVGTSTGTACATSKLAACDLRHADIFGAVACAPRVGQLEKNTTRYELIHECSTFL